MAHRNFLIVLYSAALVAVSHAFLSSQSCLVSSSSLPQFASTIQSLYRRKSTSSSLRLASSNNNDPRLEPRTIHKVSIELPLGLVLEEMDDVDPSYGVVIIGISSEGNAAAYNADIFSKIKSTGKEAGNVSSDHCICIRDKILSVNHTPCPDKGFDDVISLLSNSDSSIATLELGRLQQSTVVNYYNGICISAKAGESYGFLASKCGVDVKYECRTGNCNTCMRWMEFPDKTRDLVDKDDGSEETCNINLYERTILHCVGKVPRGYKWLHILEP